MKGTILDYSVENDLGYISGDDGKGYTFTKSNWTDTDSLPKKNLRVDFDIEGNKAIDIFVLLEVKSNSENLNTDNKLGNIWNLTVDLSKKCYTSLSNKDNKFFQNLLNFIKNNQWKTATALLILFGGYFIFSPQINGWRSFQDTRIGQGTEQEQETEKESKGRLIEVSESLPILLEDYNKLVDDFEGTGATESIKNRARSLYTRAKEIEDLASMIALRIGNFINDSSSYTTEEIKEYVAKDVILDDSSLREYQYLAYEIRDMASEVRQNCQKIIHKPY
ncbi:hypothetical protein [Geminocystis herdmanii]|uniref:hypothetical protein n=1 Tax=Geminocystis herdmanii TaxID=669359 RepID=UPI0003486410|nr:hypothetical protein [Geminocystis herdmanii]